MDVEVDECHNCDSCNMTLINAQELHLHIKNVHNGEKTNRCDMCEETFWQISSLESHISSAHLRSPQQQQTLKCDFCTNSYQDLETLEEHKKAYHGDDEDSNETSPNEETIEDDSREAPPPQLEHKNKTEEPPNNPPMDDSNESQLLRRPRRSLEARGIPKPEIRGPRSFSTPKTKPPPLEESKDIANDLEHENDKPGESSPYEGPRSSDLDLNPNVDEKTSSASNNELFEDSDDENTLKIVEESEDEENKPEGRLSDYEVLNPIVEKTNDTSNDSEDENKPEHNREGRLSDYELNPMDASDESSEDYSEDEKKPEPGDPKGHNDLNPIFETSDASKKPSEYYPEDENTTKPEPGNQKDVGLLESEELTKIEEEEKNYVVGERGLKCDQCGKIYKNKHVLDIHSSYHYNINDGVKEFSCKLCTKSFGHRSGMQYHIRKVHGEENIYKKKKQCELCNKLYSQHMEKNDVVGGKKSFKCCSCNKTFTPGNKLKIHIRSVHSTKNDVNKKRQKPEPRDDDLNPIFETSDASKKPPEDYPEDENKPEPCNQKDLGLESEDLTKIEEENYIVGERLKCDQCGKIYKNKYVLDIHTKTIHDGVKEFSCKLCKKSYGQRSGLLYHIKSVHSNDLNRKRQKCNLCGKSCNKLEKHLKIAHNMGRKNEKTTNDEFENSTDGQLIEHKKIEPNSEEESNEDIQSPLDTTSEISREILEDSMDDDDVEMAENIFDEKSFVNDIEMTTNIFEEEEGDEGNVSESDTEPQEVSPDICPDGNDTELLEVTPDIYTNVDSNINADDNIFEEQPFVMRVRQICKICGKSCNKLQKHMDKFHNRSSKKNIGSYQQRPQKCSQCGKKFKDLEKHMNNAHNELIIYNQKTSTPMWNINKREICNQCGKNCKDLEKHIKYAHPEKRAKIVVAANQDDRPLCKHCNKRMTRGHRISKEGLNAFQCCTCERRFTQIQNLSKHMRIVHEGPYKCPTCDKVFQDLILLKKHKRHGHKSRKSVLKTRSLLKTPEVHLDKSGGKMCDFCNKKFAHTASLNRHMETHHEAVRYDCGKCTKDFPTLQWLNWHLEKDHLGHKCYICNITLGNSTHVSRHISRAHSDVHSHKCKSCEETFETFANMRQHIINTHNLLDHFPEEKITYSCTKCGKKFIRLESLNWHVVKEYLGYKCYLCNKPYGSITAVAGHVSSGHSEKQSHKCEFCEETFDQFMDMRQHIMNNHNLLDHFTDDQNQIKYPCNYKTPCEKVFIRKDLLQSHLELVHQGYKWCDVCNKKFSLNNDIRKHKQMVHEGRYDCKRCKRDFSSLLWLNYHVEKDHLGHKCYVCKMAFGGTHAVTQHISRIHSDIESHQCEFCEETFDEFLDMRQHTMNTHNLLYSHNVPSKKKTYNCSKCDKTFLRLEALNLHVVKEYLGHKCYLCDMILGSITAIAGHVNTVHSDIQSHKCEFCEETFIQFMDMRQHMMNNHNLLDGDDVPNEKITYSCSKCGKKFLRLEALNLHVVKEYIGHKCYVCNLNYSSVTGVARHVSNVHSEIQSHKCEFCDETFGQFMDMRQHLMNNHSLLDRNYVESGKITYCCTKCDQKFHRLEALNLHVLKEYLGHTCYLCNMTQRCSTSIAHHVSTVHSDVQSHKCEFCEETFDQYLDMRHHLMNNHSLLDKNGIPNEKITYSCTKCNKKFLRLEALNLHVQKEYLGYRCYLCNVNYGTNTAVRIHVDTVHSEMQSHKCEFCEETFEQYVDMNHHLMHNHSLLDGKWNERKTYECNKCGQTFLRMEALNLHVLKEYLGHKCYICDKPLNSSACVARHVSTVHFEIQSHKCQFCEETFGQFEEMRHHMMNNHSLLDGTYVPCEKISYYCSKCGKKFLRLEALNLHVLKEYLGYTCYLCNMSQRCSTSIAHHVSTVHSDVQSHKCEFCKETFDQYMDMRHHLMNTHNLLNKNGIPDEKITYSCKKCDKKFLRLEALNYHVVKEYFGYICFYCNKPYGSITAVAGHVSTAHSEIQSHKCEFCEETFDQFMDMRHHLMNNHSLLDHYEVPSEKISYPCTKCGKKFVRLEALNLHVVKEHVGHKCFLCNKPYGSITAIAQHVASAHSDLQSHKCEFCEETFEEFMDMRHHLMNNHSLLDHYDYEKKSYSCTKCNKNFIKLEALNLHVQKEYLGYRCYLCNVNYGSNTAVRIHVDTVHSDIQSHKCEFCEETFVQYVDMRDHFMNNHSLLDGKNVPSEKITYYCTKCDQKFYRLEALNLHVVKEYLGNKCYLCNMTQSSITSIAHHVSTIHSDIQSHKCEFCEKVFDQFMDMRTHLMNNHSLLDKNGIPNKKITYECNRCGKTFLRLEALNLHVVKDYLGHKCYICGMTLNSTTGVSRHISTVHSEITSHECEFCEEIFVEYWDMRQHIMNNHRLLDQNDIPSKKITYSCTKCDKKFLRLEALNYHVVKEYLGLKCYLCNKPYGSITAVAGHVSSGHSEIQSHQCEFCEETYERFMDMRQHIMNNHSLLDHFTDDQNQIKYPCNYKTPCEKVFIRKELLKSHVEIFHQGYRLCELCNKQFCLGYDLQKHKQTVHDGIKAYKCHICQQNFAQDSGLRRHINAVHKSFRFECRFCNEKFPSLFWFNCHVEKVHYGYICYLCEVELHSSTSLVRHINSVHSDVTSHKCAFCDREFGQYHDLRKHTISEHKIDNFDVGNDAEGLLNLQNPSQYIDNKLIKTEPEDMENEFTNAENLMNSTEDNSNIDNAKPEEDEVGISLQNVIKTELKNDPAVQISEDSNYSMSQIVEKMQPLREENIVEKKVKPIKISLTKSTNSTTTTNESKNSAVIKSEKSTSHKCCGQNFPSDKILQNHIDSVHLPQKYKCELCAMEYSRWEKLLQHQKLVHEFTEKKIKALRASSKKGLLPPAFKPKMIEIKTEKDLDTSEHNENIHEGEKTLKKEKKVIVNKVDTCEEENSKIGRSPAPAFKKPKIEIKTEKDLDHSEHKGNVHEGQKILNNENNRENINKVDVMATNNVSLPVKKFACNMCKNSFDVPMALKDHILAKHGSMKIYNDFVRNMFEKNSKSNSKPPESSDSNGIKPIRNEEEKKVVHESRNGLLGQHKLSEKLKNTKQPGFSKPPQSLLKNTMNQTCKKCNQIFFSSRNLQRHIESVHEKLKNFECDQCGKKFTRKESLSHHMKFVHQII